MTALAMITAQAAIDDDTLLGRDSPPHLKASGGVHFKSLRDLAALDVATVDEDPNALR